MTPGTFPQPPKSLTDKGAQLKIRRIDLFSYACLESTHRYAFSENEAKVYAGISQIHGMRYRAKKVEDKLYFFDEEELGAYVDEVGKDFNGFMLARRFSRPLIGLGGASSDAALSVAKRILQRTEGAMLHPYMAWESLFRKATGARLQDLGVTTQHRSEFSAAMMAFAKQHKFHVAFYRELDALMAENAGNLTVFAGMRIRQEVEWALSRKGTLFHIKAPGGYYGTKEQPYGDLRQEETAATLIVDSPQSEERAAEFILKIYDDSRELGFLQTG